MGAIGDAVSCKPRSAGVTDLNGRFIARVPVPPVQQAKLGRKLGVLILNAEIGESVLQLLPFGRGSRFANRLKN
jgi:hypothetical protein